MKRFLTRYRGALRFTLALLPLAAAAGYLMLRYQMALYDEDTMAAMVAQLGSTTALLAIGMTIVIITSGIDLSVGATLGLSGRAVWC